MSIPTPETIEAALFKVESIHHIHGVQCLCGFKSHVSRDRTKHIMAVTLAAVAPIVDAKAEAWDEGAVAAWERSTPTVNGTHFKWRHEGEPLNPYRAATIEGKGS